MSFVKRWVSVFLELRLTLFSALVFLFLYGSLQILYRDGREIFQEQKNALALEVFSQTDLSTDALKLLEEQLRALDGVDEVVASSPESSLERLLQEPELELDLQWLTQRSKEKKGMILPWSYTLHLSRWDEPTLKELVEKIEHLKVGHPAKKAVMEVHYDKERWSLVVALFHYLKWLRAVLLAGVFLLCFFLVVLFGSAFWKWKEENRSESFRQGQAREKGRTFFQFLLEGSNFREMLAACSSGLCAGLLAAFLCLLVLAGTFFSNSIYWTKFLKGFLFSQLFFGMLIALAGFVWKRIHEEK